MEVEAEEPLKAGPSTPTQEQYLKLTKQLLTSASRLGKSLAELFTLLVKVTLHLSD